MVSTLLLLVLGQIALTFICCGAVLTQCKIQSDNLCTNERLNCTGTRAIVLRWGKLQRGDTSSWESFDRETSDALMKACIGAQTCRPWSEILATVNNSTAITAIDVSYWCIGGRDICSDTFTITSLNHNFRLKVPTTSGTVPAEILGCSCSLAVTNSTQVVLRDVRLNSRSDNSTCSSAKLSFGEKMYACNESAVDEILWNKLYRYKQDGVVAIELGPVDSMNAPMRVVVTVRNATKWGVVNCTHFQYPDLTTTPTTVTTDSSTSSTSRTRPSTLSTSSTSRTRPSTSSTSSSSDTPPSTSSTSSFHTESSTSSGSSSITEESTYSYHGNEPVTGEDGGRFPVAAAVGGAVGGAAVLLGTILAVVCYRRRTQGRPSDKLPVNGEAGERTVNNLMHNPCYSDMAGDGGILPIVQSAGGKPEDGTYDEISATRMKASAKSIEKGSVLDTADTDYYNCIGRDEGISGLQDGTEQKRSADEHQYNRIDLKAHPVENGALGQPGSDDPYSHLTDSPLVKDMYDHTGLFACQSSSADTYSHLTGSPLVIDTYDHSGHLNGGSRLEEDTYDHLNGAKQPVTRDDVAAAYSNVAIKSDRPTCTGDVPDRHAFAAPRNPTRWDDLTAPDDPTPRDDLAAPRNPTPREDPVYQLAKAINDDLERTDDKTSQQFCLQELPEEEGSHEYYVLEKV